MYILLFCLLAFCVGCTTAPLSWDKCTLSSNWHGKNANMRIMNILSPRFSDQQFQDRYNWAKGRNVNYFNLFVINKGDGEGAGYSMFGSDFSGNYGKIDKAFSDIMTARIKQIYDDGYGVVLWLMADDSNAWAKKFASNPQVVIDAMDSLGWFKYASIIVIGLELDEFYNASQVNSIYTALRTKWGGMIGTHHTSSKYTFYNFGDIVFYQVNPNTATKTIISQCKNVAAKTGKKIVAFEIERQEARGKCQQILDAGAAYSVGNW